MHIEAVVEYKRRNSFITVLMLDIKAVVTGQSQILANLALVARKNILLGSKVDTVDVDFIIPAVLEIEFASPSEFDEIRALMQ